MDAGYTALSVEDSKALKKRYDKLNKIYENQRTKEYNEKKKQLDAAFNLEEKQQKLRLAKGEISEAKYNSAVYKAKAKYYQDLLALAQKYGQDTTEIQNKMMDDHIKALEAEKKRVKEEMEEMTKVYAMEHPDQNMSDEDYNKLLDQQRRQGYKEKLGTIPGETDEEFDARIEAYEAFQEELLKKAADIRASITEDTARKAYETELAWIENLHKQGLLSEEEYEKAKLNLKISYAAKVAQEVNKYAQIASDFVTALKESETAKLDAEYQAQLTAAGNNAEEREAIDADYEKKKLDLQKKYADTEMVINIAKAIAAGALAAIEAFAAAGNPILGAVFAAIIAATTALEVATIVKQRNAIKNASASGGGGAASAPSTGQRTITGHAEGGYTENHTTLSTVGEEGVEWIAPHWMVRDNPTTFANLEHYRKTGSHGRSGSISRGFADGGYTGKVADDLSKGMSTADIEAAVEAAIMKTMATGAIRAYLVRNDLTEIDNQDARFKDIFTL